MEHYTKSTCLIVVREAPVLVTPAQHTPLHVLPLSSINIFSGPSTVNSSHLLVFQSHPDRKEDNPVEVIAGALARILVPYYPLAGRLRTSEQGKLEVDCNGRGAVFVEAHANVTLVEMNMLDKTCWAQLQYDVMADCVTGSPPLVVQVTRLHCGGFILCVRLCHGLCDAAGVLQFLNGWAEMARGLQNVSIPPVWGREIPKPTPRPFRVHVPSLNLMHSQELFCCRHESHDPHAFTPSTHLDISYDAVVSLRRQLLRAGTSKCNSFEALAAHFWRERTRALHVPPTKEVRLFFLADHVSYETQEHLPVGFYGLYGFNCQAITTAGELLERPLSHAVQLIQSAKAGLEKNFADCYTDFAELHCPCGFSPPEVLLFTETWKITTWEVDFGWGKPSRLDVVRLTSHVNVVALAHRPNDYDSLHVLMNNIPPTAVEKLGFQVRDIPTSCCSDSKM